MPCVFIGKEYPLKFDLLAAGKGVVVEELFVGWLVKAVHG